MAENNNDKAVSFSIEDTMDTGIGNAELIRDLMEPESVSGNADDLEPVVEEKKETKKETKKVVKKEVQAEKEEEKKEEGNDHA